MGEWAARAITIGSIVLTIASLAVAVLFARKASRVRVGFDVARAAVGVIAILVMAAITNVTTPLFSIVLAITGGLALGFGQGSNLEVTKSERGLFSKRNPIGIALWGAGIVVMQAAGIASRTGMVKIGQTIAWFSVCLGVGLLAGRTGPVRGARQAIAGGGAAMLLAVLILPSAAFVGGAAVPAVADTPLLTDDEVCDLIAPVESHLYAATGLLPGRDLHTRMTGVEPLAPVVNAVAACKQEGYETYTAQGFVEYTVYLFASVEDAQAQYAAEVAANEAWYAPEWEEAQERMEQSETVHLFIGTGPLDDYDVVGIYWIAFPAIRVVTTTGPFMLYGVVTDTLAYDLGLIRPDRTREPGRFLIETLLIPMSDTAHNIDAYLAATEPPPPEPVDEETTTSTEVAQPDEDDSTSVTEDTQQDLDTALPSITDGPRGDEPIEPEEAAGQAVAGLVAAAAIGLITLGEASGEIGRILGGMGGGGSTTAPPQEPFIDPYDQKPLETDPETGMVWWPWDGGEGQWVDAAVVPGLLDDWNRELDAETARRVGAHRAQADRDWDNLRRTTREQTQAELDRLETERARRAREQIVTDRIRDIAEEADFDAMVSWIDENPVPTGAQLDALRESLSRHLGAHKAIGAMPTNAEVWRTAISRTIGSDADWDSGHFTVDAEGNRTWQPGHVTVADVADLFGMGALLRNPEVTARVGAAVATGGWSEVAVIPFVDVRRAIEDANNAREAAGLPDLTADEARFISNVTIIKAVTIDQVMERGLPAAIGAMRGTNTAAREAAEASLGRSISRGRTAASEAVETSARRALPGDEALGRGVDEGLTRAAPDAPRPPGDGDFGTMGGGDDVVGAGGRGGDEGFTAGRRPSPEPAPAEPAGGGGPPRSGPPDEIRVNRGAELPGRTPPPGVHPPKPPQSAIDDLTLGRGPQQDSLGGPGVQPRWDGDPKKIFEGMDDGAQAAHPPSTRPTPPRGPEEPAGMELGEIDEFHPSTLDDVFGPRTPIEPVTAQPGGLDPGDFTHPSWIDEIEGIKDVEDLGLSGGSTPTPRPTVPPPIDAPPTPPAPRPTPPPPVDTPPAPPARPPDQDLSDAIFRGEEPSGIGAADDLEIRGEEQFAGTRHDGQAGWSAEALSREETFWTAGRSDVTPIIGPSGGDVAPQPNGFNVQMNPRTRTATPIFGDALTPTQKARIKEPGGPFDQAVARINRILDDLETPP